MFGSSEMLVNAYGKLDKMCARSAETAQGLLQEGVVVQIIRVIQPTRFSEFSLNINNYLPNRRGA